MFLCDHSDEISVLFVGKVPTQSESSNSIISKLKSKSNKIHSSYISSSFIKNHLQPVLTRCSTTLSTRQPSQGIQDIRKKFHVRPIQRVKRINRERILKNSNRHEYPNSRVFLSRYSASTLMQVASNTRHRPNTAPWNTNELPAYVISINKHSRRVVTDLSTASGDQTPYQQCNRGWPQCAIHTPYTVVQEWNLLPLIATSFEEKIAFAPSSVEASGRKLRVKVEKPRERDKSSR